MLSFFNSRAYCANQRIIIFAVYTVLFFGLNLWEGSPTLLCTSEEIKALGTSGIPHMHIKVQGDLDNFNEVMVTYQKDAPDGPRTDYKLRDLAEFHGKGRVFDWVFATDPESLRNTHTLHLLQYNLQGFDAKPLESPFFRILLTGELPTPNLNPSMDKAGYFIHLFESGSYDLYQRLMVADSSASYVTNLKKWLGSDLVDRDFHTIRLANGEIFPVLKYSIGQDPRTNPDT